MSSTKLKVHPKYLVLNFTLWCNQMMGMSNPLKVPLGLLEGLSGGKLQAIYSALQMPLMSCRLEFKLKEWSKFINPFMTLPLTLSNHVWWLRVRLYLPLSPSSRNYPGVILLLAVSFLHHSLCLSLQPQHFRIQPKDLYL
jgi:hypothetical protein